MNATFEQLLLQIARLAIKEKLVEEVLIDKSDLLKSNPQLDEPGAVFVTLKKNGDLRGCIGSIQPYRSLLDDIIENAVSAAFHDPRFNPLTKDELPDISIEISILSAPEVVEYHSVAELKQKVKRGIDGIVLSNGYHRAVFLPQVWEQLPGFDLFFEHLCKKAGLSTNCLNDFPRIEKFHVTIIEEP